MAAASLSLLHTHTPPLNPLIKGPSTTAAAAAAVGTRRSSILLTSFLLWTHTRPAVALEFDFRMTVPDQTVEEAESSIQSHAQSLVAVKDLLAAESWREAQKQLRRSSALLKQDVYTIIQAKPSAERPRLRKLYADLFNAVTRLDYAARDKDRIRVWECYHGLWPDYNDGTWPACCPGKRFDIKKISKLQSTMNKYWPSYNCESSSNCYGGNGSFWEHEWEKHGPCSFPVVRDEYDYFRTVLNLYFKYNVTEVLREVGYVASNCKKYPLSGIVSAIQNAYHATPALVCSGDAIEELRLCFCKDFKIRDCAVEIPSESLCPKHVSLPKFVSSGGFGNKEAQALKLET